ncbi:hypothetical protein [Thalassotalea castellviae]|uniref:Uncharacterized protein n=1 Tax=Thalassotalea castellviae TaxID=3075612 RepID=A0ABU3A306_9GAMM|nr:hypothetical protein [Thalassotalea sp. W431]MDT0603493.1 hypothetical protein [Thalassotalea sp. W431]
MKTFLKISMGVTSGSFAGRDDGHPKPVFELIDNYEELFETYERDAAYYEVKEIHLSKVVEAFKGLSG